MHVNPYISIARPSHWVKNIFVVPGILLARLLAGPEQVDVLSWFVLGGFVAACLVASSNYVLNEILDAKWDRYHPDKAMRPIPSGVVRMPLAWMEYIVLGIAGVGLAFAINKGVGFSCLLLWIMGWVYNVPPLRLKDRPFADVLCESINNPIRLAIGWHAAGIHRPLTFSAIMAYWMFGAFLMAVKRFAEYRHIADRERAGLYRLSFRYYTEEYLLLSILFYATTFGMSAGVFMARYRVELVLVIPFVALAMAQYLHAGFKSDSIVQHPERLHHDPKLFVVVMLAFGVSSALMIVDIPLLSRFFQPWGQP
jgi:decaprenyl-phosphate phosphoribosyltransferase